MKRFVLLFMVGLFSIGCNGQRDDKINPETNESEARLVEQPEGTWRVDREFDENGNLIRYDSIYSWSSHNDFNNLSPSARDSMIQSFKSRFFMNYSHFEDQGFEDVFAKDSLFSDRFFNDGFFGSDFGQDFMVIDSLRQRMLERQNRFLKKYQSEFKEPKDEN